jgi:hypothetical protein
MNAPSLPSPSHRTYILDQAGVTVACKLVNAEEACQLATHTRAIRVYVPGCRTVSYDPLAGTVLQDLIELNQRHRSDLDELEEREDVLVNDLGRHLDQLSLERREHLLGTSLVMGETNEDRLHLCVFLIVPRHVRSCDLVFSL